MRLGLANAHGGLRQHQNSTGNVRAAKRRLQLVTSTQVMGGGDSERHLKTPRDTVASSSLASMAMMLGEQRAAVLWLVA